MENGFYLADETHLSLKGELVQHKGVLFFKQSRTGFDGKATAEHIKWHPFLFETFLKAHPDFVLPSSFEDISIGAPKAQAVEVVEATPPKVEDIAPEVVADIAPEVEPVQEPRKRRVK